MRAVRSPSGVVVAGEDVSLSLLFLLLLGAEIMSIMLGYHDEDIYLSVSFLPSRGCGFIYLSITVVHGWDGFCCRSDRPINNRFTRRQKGPSCRDPAPKRNGKKRTPVYVCVNVRPKKTGGIDIISLRRIHLVSILLLVLVPAGLPVLIQQRLPFLGDVLQRGLALPLLALSPLSLLPVLLLLER